MPPAQCTDILAAPAGKALVVKTLQVDTYSNPNSHQINFVGISVGPGECGSLVLFANPATLGLTSIPLDPGVTVPAGQSLRAFSGGNLGVEVYAMGYSGAHDRRRPLLGHADDLRGGRFGASLLEQLRPLALGLGANRRGALPDRR